MTVHVHVEHARRFVEEVIVKRRHVETVVQHGGHHRVDFVFGQHEVAHHDVTVIAFSQRDPAAETEWRRRRYAVDAHVDVVPRNVDLEDAILVIAVARERFQHRGVLRRHFLCDRRLGKNERSEQNQERTHAVHIAQHVLHQRCYG